MSSLDFSAVQIATVIAAMGVGNILGPLAGGYLADAIGRKRTMVISLFGSALATLGIYAAAHDYALLLKHLIRVGDADLTYTIYGRSNLTSETWLPVDYPVH